ncbi:pore-forming ESAT-6 family protein [Paracoccus xiamenensis]|uniref:pore-forming ESAT-6 family protein n=1 Tax=Paracoccus xiamenensis TaxID=2714901 RepID=UPI00140E5389|nr:pore-forming ESAT-6 family protein [Paracoccus xiamenensis]NHF73633.1 hypothetical protein [Paracoccus xiamenensis]
MLKTSILTLSLAFVGTAALAQTATPDPDAAAAAAQNQLGILEYCQAEGHIEGSAVEIQTKMIEMVPAAENQETVDAAYAKGKEGTVSAMGVEQTLADAATAQSTDVKALCGQLASLVEQAAAQMPK